MKTCLLALALWLGASRAFAQLSPADEAAIRRTVQRITANYTDHHFADMAAYTTSDVSWVNIVGMWWRGRAQVQQVHQQIFDTIFNGVVFTPGNADDLLTLVLVKKPAGWLLSAGQNTVVRASAQSNNPIGKTSLAPFDPAKLVDIH